MARYEIDAQIMGEGGFGKIRKGIDRELHRPIAIKTLDPVWEAADENDKARFRREARILAKLSHPNIPAIYDVVFAPKEFHIVFQFIAGKNLRQLLSEGPMPLVEVRRWFDQVAAALQHAHENGIIHRDIKPENMIVSDEKKHCYLVDFGLALSRTDLERLTPSDHWVGTPGYMSPEQENGEQLDPSDDLFSLGICLYETLCGHRVTAGNYEELSLKDETIPPSIDE